MQEALARASESNFFFLEYDHIDNVFRSVDLDKNDIKEALEQDNVYCVTIDCRNGIQKYIVEANDDNQAIDYVSTFLDGQYYTAKATELNLAKLVSEGIEAI